jgi:hypothetical protein
MGKAERQEPWGNRMGQAKAMNMMDSGSIICISVHLYIIY